ncbi:MAG: trigger factor [Coriobacteriales bacterium]
MKVSKKKAGEGKTRVTVTVEGSGVTDQIDNYSQQFCTALGIEVAEGSWAHSELTAAAGADATRKMIDDAIMKDNAEIAITMLDLDIIAAPRYFAEKSAREGEDFTFEAVVFDKPQFELSDYGPVTVNVPDLEVTEDDIQYLIARDAQGDVHVDTLTDRNTVQAGDDIEMSLLATQYGEVLDDISSDSRRYTVGVKLMPAEFDKHIIGMKVGDTAEFDFMMPGAIDEQGNQGQPVSTHATITVKRILKNVMPDITDEWVAEHIPGCSTYDEYRAKLEDEAAHEKAMQHRQSVASACAAALGERIVGDLPDDIFQACLEDLKEQFTTEARQMHMTVDEYREQLGLNPQQFSMATMFQVEAQLRQTFALEALARKLEMEVEEEDYDKLYGLIAPGHEGLAQAQFERNGRTFVVTEAALHAKANQYLMDHAVITNDKDKPSDAYI